MDLQIGDHVHVEGELQTRSYKAGGKRQGIVEVVVTSTGKIDALGDPQDTAIDLHYLPTEAP